MSLSIVYTRAQLGIDAPLVRVETHISNGLPSLTIVGLPETAVRESRERVRSAILNSGFEFPTRRITINLAPADLPKQGGRYDLAIAMGILLATGQLPELPCANMEFLAEVSLTGELRPVHGVLPSAIACGEAGRAIVVASDNAEEAAWSGAEPVFGAKHLLELCRHCREGDVLPPIKAQMPNVGAASAPDLRDVQGQFLPRRALEVAAAGRHNLLFYGPPGTGKSMLAARLPGLLPPLDKSQALEVASLYSLVGHSRLGEQFLSAPFRTPHHSASSPSLVGGGSLPKPGEISLAHHGVLFLDELPEFGRQVLEVLREPLESGEIHIARAQASLCFPARFQLLAAMNPCPCGYTGHPTVSCQCSAQQVSRYRNKLSGPLLDRFDLQVEVGVQPGKVVLAGDDAESSASVAKRVRAAQERQLSRQGVLNYALSTKALAQHCRLSSALQQQLEMAMERLALSARGAHRVLRVARTLADLEQQVHIDAPQLKQALSYRALTRMQRVEAFT